MTGAENLKFVCRIYDKDIAETTDFVRDFSELGPYFHEPLGTYSSGMRARLSFALSLAVDFQVYVIDEGLSVGDAAFRRKAQLAFAERRTSPRSGRSTPEMSRSRVDLPAPFRPRTAVDEPR